MSMHANQKIYIFYTARKASTRLRDKMLKVIENKTVLELGLQRALTFKLAPVILCTTYLSEDDILDKTCKGYNVACYRGDVDDILGRYLGAARQYSVDFFIAIDGDDLFVEKYYVSKIIKKFRETNADYIYCDGLPYGTYATGVKVKALERIYRLKNNQETSGWGRFFTRTHLFHTEKISALPRHRHLEYRLTLDYPEDFRLIKSIYAKLYRHSQYFSIDQVFELLKQKPQLAKINAKRIKEYAARFKKKYSDISLKINPK